MDKEKIVVQSSGGIGLGGLVFLLFLALKLLGKIDWSWWWVTCPLWIGIATVFAVLFAFLLFIFLAACISGVARLFDR